MNEIPEQYRWNQARWEQATDEQPYYWVGEQAGTTPQRYHVGEAASRSQIALVADIALPAAIRIVQAMRYVAQQRRTRE